MNSFKYTAIIIEPRKHAALKFVLENFFVNLSNEWGFIIFYGNTNKDFIDNLFETDLQIYKFRVIKFVPLNVDNLTTKSYNSLLMSHDFYNNINTEIFLIFQTDSIILSKNKELINDYLIYDYVGAPWYFNNQIGNGGLSLRKKTKMIEILNNVKMRKKPNEDYFFSMQTKIKLNKPSFEDAKKFSIETIYCENSWGVHNVWSYIKPELLKKLCDEYPEILNLIKLQPCHNENAINFLRSIDA